ncbi:UDP-N-acetylglucosamine--N-acetylmuramyl-(pentapeptide) pyrophosphoryl-undecaprenol N-acetylglucosamine transferase [Methanobacterium oryzae]|uniref:UDP-N-acetylglucosamine--N-acetylmuramyl- (pentapeptide) pyrophosphoryl-undecaprenol N-acetylglucosamine transferase n=1 Tax=Methanobacterium oryzae TaxID=69540 RepID=UPI003D1FB01B
MKVLMMPCGIGMGHVSRCIALAEKLKERGANVVFASYGSGYEMLVKSENYETIKLPDIKFYGNGGELDIKYTAKKSIDAPFIFLKSIYNESKIIKRFKPDIVVADSHYSVPITCKVLGIPCIMVTNELTLDFAELYPDDKTIEYLENGLKRFITDVSNQCNAILIPDIEDSIEVPPKLKDMTIFTGPFLKKTPDNLENKIKIRKKYGFNENDKIILVTVGGSDFGKRLLRLIYNASEYIECNKIVMITGPQIESNFIPDSDKIIKKEFLEDIMEWMKLSDLAISLAGHTTTMELASLGVPNILVPIDNHPEQFKNALNMEKYGISLVKKIKELNTAGFIEDINKLLNDNDLERKVEITRRKFSEYKGTEEAVNIILKHAESKKQYFNEQILL